MKEKINLYLDMIGVLLIVGLMTFLIVDSDKEYYPLSGMWILSAMGAVGLILKWIVILIDKIRKK